MAEKEYESIVQLLREKAIPFEEFEHEAVRTSEQAAAVRGSRVGDGVKALLVKFTRTQSPGAVFFAVIDIPGDRRLDWKKAKSVLQASDVKFASEEEVRAQTGCEPGGVPPFGHANSLAILADPAVFDKEFVEFNAGMTTKSIRIKAADLRKTLDSLGAAYFDLAKTD